MGKNFMFNSLEKKNQEIVVMAMEKKEYKDKDVVIKQGDDINLELDTGQLVPIEGVETVLDPSMFGTPAEPQTP